MGGGGGGGGGALVVRGLNRINFILLSIVAVRLQILTCWYQNSDLHQHHQNLFMMSAVLSSVCSLSNVGIYLGKVAEVPSSGEFNDELGGNILWWAEPRVSITYYSTSIRCTTLLEMYLFLLDFSYFRILLMF